MAYTEILAINNPSFNALSTAEQILFSALQGLANKGAAGFGGQAVYCVANNFNGIDFQPLAAQSWLDQVPIQPTDKDPWALISSPSTIKSYILYDLQANPGSANVASSLAGVLNALPVDVSLQSKIAALDLSQVADVREWDVEQVIASYPGRFNQGFAVELNTGFATDVGIGWGPRDYAVANNALVFFGDDERSLVMSQLNPCSAIYGWGPVTAEGEEAFISDVGQSGNYYVAADSAFNLSFFSNLAESSQPVPATAAGVGPAIEGKCVAFIVSDGDNLQWLLNRGVYEGWWGSPLRGSLTLGWTVSPSLYNLAPTVWNYYVGSLKDGEEMVCGPSGIGYVYDNIAGASSFPAFLEKTNSFMAATNIKAVDAFGLNSDTEAYFEGFAGQGSIDGVVYASYSPWVVLPGLGNQVCQGKPVVPYTLDLSGNAEQVAQTILSDPDPTATYAVYVDAWGNEYSPLETVQSVCELLVQGVGTDGPSISIVKPSQLLAQVLALSTPASPTGEP